MGATMVCILMASFQEQFSSNEEKSSFVPYLNILGQEMVFCYKNCSDLLWEKLLKFETDGREFAKFGGSLEQFIETVKGQYNFW